MRIAFFSTLMNAPWGGSEILWCNTALYMRKQGLTVSAFVKQWPADPKPIMDLRNAGVEIYYYTSFPKQGVFSKSVRKIGAFNGGAPLAKLLRWRPDFVFFSQGHSYDLAYFSKQTTDGILKCPVPFSVISQNNTDYSFVPETAIRQTIKLIYEKAFRSLFVSERNRATAERIICSSIGNAMIISNSLSVAIAETGILPMPANDAVNFACVARLRCSHKGQNLLMHVLSGRQWQDRKWRLNLYGSGEDESYLHELARFLRIDDRVKFNGQITDIKNVWKENHIALLASFGEGMPLALQEAMLFGRPVVASDVGGNPELIEDGKTGWLAEGSTFSAYGRALERAWAAMDSWESVGVQAYKKATAAIDLYPENALLQIVKSACGG